MKKIIITLLFAGTSLYSFSQTEFAIGLKGGPNFASLNPEESTDKNYESRTGFHLGVFALIKGKKVGFQPELLFSQQGSKVTYSGQPDIKTNFSYVNVPLIIKLYTIAGINLQVGPQVGFLTTKKFDDYDQSGQVTEKDVEGNFKTTDFSLALGVGWDLPFGLTIDGRYNLGLSDVNDGYSTAPSSTIKNQVWQFSVGYKLFKF